jgi:hypothetical protein
MQVDKSSEQAKRINEETSSQLPPTETGEVWEAPQLEKYGSLEKITLLSGIPGGLTPEDDIMP